MDIRKIGFGGSCHWCTEAIFQSLKGVVQVEQGWISAREEADFHEAVIVHFDPGKISGEILIEIHLHTHSSTSEHALRRNYRSAVYVFDEEQKIWANKALESLQRQFEAPLITRAYLFSAFRSSNTSFQNYYRSNPDKPFCKSYIDPKLRLLMTRFSEHTDKYGNAHQTHIN